MADLPNPSFNLARTGWLLAGAAALTGVFALYAQPDFLVLMIDQVWACF